MSSKVKFCTISIVKIKKTEAQRSQVIWPQLITTQIINRETKIQKPGHVVSKQSLPHAFSLSKGSI
jgi:hypothetical protein